MTNKEFQEWLKQWDDDVNIECVVHYRGVGYYDQGGNASTECFNPTMSQGSPAYCLNGHCDYAEWRGDKTLTIGSVNN